MTDDLIIAVCPKCQAKNRLPGSRWKERLRCGRDKELLDLQTLYPGRPVNATDATFQREVADFKGPVLAEFFAPW